MNDNYNPTATEVRILSAEGGIIRWDGAAAETIAQILSAFADAARAKGKPLPTPIVIPPCKVRRKVTVVEGRYFDDGTQVTICHTDHAGRTYIEDLLPRGVAEDGGPDEEGHEIGPPRVYRFEVEVIDPADMERPKPKLEVVPS